MQLKKVEVGIVKHKLTRLDDFNFEHTWLRLKIEADLEPGDVSQEIIQQLRGELQGEVEAWIEVQPGYETTELPGKSSPADRLEEVEVMLEASDVDTSDDIPD